MTTRRTTAATKTSHYESPLSEDTTTTANLAPSTSSPFLPTRLEALFLALYPTILVLGSLYGTLHPSTRNAIYSPTTQSFLPETAPSYFAQKKNPFNVYFVKVGWLWMTSAFAAHVFTSPAFRRAGQLDLKRVQAALLRYAAITTFWVFVTQWCFGAPLIDRSFRWTGGQCELLRSGEAKDDMSDAREVFTHAACRAIGGQWAGGHDISGHVFLLILGSAMLVLEVLPGVLGGKATKAGEGTIGVGGWFALAVSGASLWMLLMTAAYFHTWFEKLTGFVVATTAVYAVYFLPRAVAVLRSVLGTPGV